MERRKPMLDVANLEPNPSRAIWVEGHLDESHVERIRPEILELNSRSHEPITVFLNSSGGSPEVMREILSLLRPSKLITVAAPNAALCSSERGRGHRLRRTNPCGPHRRSKPSGEQDERLVPREFMSPDPKKIGAVVRSQKKLANIPGVRIWCEKNFHGRTV